MRLPIFINKTNIDFTVCQIRLEIGRARASGSSLFGYKTAPCSSCSGCSTECLSIVTQRNEAACRHSGSRPVLKKEGKVPSPHSDKRMDLASTLSSILTHISTDGRRPHSGLVKDPKKQIVNYAEATLCTKRPDDMPALNTVGVRSI